MVYCIWRGTCEYHIKHNVRVYHDMTFDNIQLYVCCWHQKSLLGSVLSSWVDYLNGRVDPKHKTLCKNQELPPTPARLNRLWKVHQPANVLQVATIKKSACEKAKIFIVKKHYLFLRSGRRDLQTALFSA